MAANSMAESRRRYRSKPCATPRCEGKQWSRGLCRGCTLAAGPARLFPTEPLRQVLDRKLALAIASHPNNRNASLLSISYLRERFGIDNYTMQAILTKKYIRWDVADRVCGKLGYHPTEIFGDSWFVAGGGAA